MSPAGSTFGFGSLITESLRIAWRLKTLWIFGFLVEGIPYGVHFTFRDEWEEYDWALDSPELGAALLLLAFSVGGAILILAGVLYVISQGALAYGGAKYAVGEYVRVGDSWRRGYRRFFPLFVYYFLIVVGQLVAGTFLLGIPLFAGIVAHPWVGVLVGLLALPVLIALWLFWVPISSYAVRGIVLENDDPIRALGRGLSMVRGNPGRAAMISVLRLLFTLGTGTASALIGMFLAGPLILLWAAWPPLAIGAGVFVTLPVLLVVSGYLGGVGSYYWTLSYMWTEGLRPADTISDTSSQLPAPDRPA